MATGVALATVGGVGLNVLDIAGPSPVAQAAAAVDANGCPTTTTTTTTPTATATATVTTATSTATTTTTAYATKTATTTAPNCPYVGWLPGWRPKLGPVFNDPLGSSSDAQAIVRRVYQAIMHAKRGSQIRIAVYSFDRSEIAYALRKAKQRGVSVQVIVAQKVMSSVARKLQSTLGKNPRKANFLISCPGRCRNGGKTAGNEHDKVFAFSRSGGAQYLVITGSGNLTSKAVYRQWNDSYAVANDKQLYDTWLKMFNQMKFKKQTGARVLTYTTTSGAYSYWFQRKAAAASDQLATLSTTTLQRYNAKTDRPAKQISKISCKAPKGYGANGRTTIRLAMYAMFGARGRALTKMLVAKKKQGCDVKVIMSVPGSQWPTLTKAGIPTRSADWEFTYRDPLLEDGIGGYGPRFYSHLKYMAVSGTYNGQPANLVVTGSENWDGLSKANEEVVLQINSANVYKRYANHFNKLFTTKATHRMGVKPLGGPGSVR
ncbi:phospholipase D-like domain-containing protein [Nocardioides sp.]|uniref:phospholipase D-like domain-containing protein n=1 Tax=Nocardioides sp. TaxID=35761 RepID=UPI00260C2E9B|nr:phospholipase D-like domain-containing protein [Nocardioides sp.]